MITLQFDTFWEWLSQHPNCLIRVGTMDAVLYDDTDLHWYVGPLDGQLVVQAIRGKRLMGEVVVEAERVAYVQDLGEEREGEHVFELIQESSSERLAAYQFVLTHGLETESDSAHGPLAVH